MNPVKIIDKITHIIQKLDLINIFLLFLLPYLFLGDIIKIFLNKFYNNVSISNQYNTVLYTSLYTLILGIIIYTPWFMFICKIRNIK